MALDDKLDRVLSRHEELAARLAEPEMAGSDDFVRLSKEYSDLTPLVEAITELKRTRDELADLDEMLEAGEVDAEMRELAREERDTLAARLPDLEHRIKLLLLPKDEADEKSVILEVRAGTGGDEAALFAADLLRMYQRYADLHGWKVEIMEANETELGGFKEVVAAVKGENVFARLKYESGVHRVQRVPGNRSGWAHSHLGGNGCRAARSRGGGHQDRGQGPAHRCVPRLGRRRSARQHDRQCRAHHPCADRHCRRAAGRTLSAQESGQGDAHSSRPPVRGRARRARQRAAESRKSQVGSGDRSERIRTYNFPQGRVTDHRIGLTLYKLDQIISGEALDEVIDALIAEDQAAQLAEMA